MTYLQIEVITGLNLLYFEIFFFICLNQIAILWSFFWVVFKCIFIVIAIAIYSLLCQNLIIHRTLLCCAKCALAAKVVEPGEKKHKYTLLLQVYVCVLLTKQDPSKYFDKVNKCFNIIP